LKISTGLAHQAGPTAEARILSSFPREGFHDGRDDRLFGSFDSTGSVLQSTPLFDSASHKGMV